MVPPKNIIRKKCISFLLYNLILNVRGPLRGFPRKLSQIPDIFVILVTEINHDILPIVCVIGSKLDHACRENCQLLTSVQVGSSSVRKKGESNIEGIMEGNANVVCKCLFAASVFHRQYLLGLHVRKY